MKTIILGLDAFDPRRFESLLEAGRMPNLQKYAEEGKYRRFQVSNPPQSEVSWTSIATGADPGVHGMFDFVHRDPGTYGIIPSLLVTRTNVLGTQFVPPYTTRTLFEQATLDGYPSTTLWWPATFPARPEVPVQTIPGLGTPDILGRLGVGAVYTPDREMADEKYKTAVEVLESSGKNSYRGAFKGPSRKTSSGEQEITLDFRLEIKDSTRAILSFAKTSLDLTPGEWSPIFEVRMKAGFLASIHGITRAILTQIEPEPKLYFLPLQIHPMHSMWRYGTPPGFVKKTWKDYGPYLTLGWPQDTTALDEGWITDEQFLDLCRSILDTRERIFLQQLETFQEGVLGNVFDSLDRVQHMFLHGRPDIIEAWYIRLDKLAGKVSEKANSENARLLILSDHGFAQFDHKVHLNKWLIDNSYMTLHDEDGEMNLTNVDWSKSQAYALGLNSLYINLAGREGEGSVQPGEIEALRARISQDLSSWLGPDGKSVVQRVYMREEVFNGPRLPDAPDLVIGYADGYRSSAETGLGKWEQESLVENMDLWHADHCIDPDIVPGVLFSNQEVDLPQHPSFRDIPSMAIGKDLEHPDTPKGGTTSGSKEDQEIIEERLKGLGYL